MDINEAIRHAIDGNAILFTGSGFSFGSKNLTNDSPMTGRAFAQYLYKESNIVTTDENLALASQLYVKNFGAAKLADLCRATFSIRSSADHHQSVVRLPWQRIYTTNYDDLLEKSSTDIGKSLVPVTIEDSPEKYLSSARVRLHINGFISRLAVTDLAGGFKLTAGSYFYDGLTTSSWGTVLRLCTKSLEISFPVESAAITARRPRWQNGTNSPTQPGIWLRISSMKLAVADARA